MINTTKMTQKVENRNTLTRENNEVIFNWHIDKYIEQIGKLTKIGCPPAYRKEIRELLERNASSEEIQQVIESIARVIRLRRRSRIEMKRRRILRHMKRHNEDRKGWWTDEEGTQSIGRETILNIHKERPETVIGNSQEIFRDKAGNILSAERVWELSFVRSIRPDGTAVDGLDRPITRHFI